MMDVTNDQPLGAISVLSGLTDVDLAFGEIARWLRQQPGIRRSSHSVHMSRRRPDDDAPAALVIEFYVAAVHESECGVDFILEMTCADGEWLIESSVRGGGRDLDDIVLAFPDRLAITDQELLAELDGATRMIVESRTRALQTFVLDYVGQT